MCVYCNVGDHFFRYDPPFRVDPFIYPTIPQPLTTPINPWPLDRLLDLQDMLRRIKALEDQLGCPCEPNKADYLSLLKERIETLEKVAAEKGTP